MRALLTGGLLAALAAPLASQATGRTMQLLAPAVVGQTATFGMTYPASAAGNLYVFLWCAPPFPGTATLVVPGFTLLGAIRVDPQNSVGTWTGVLGASGALAHPLAIPTLPSLVGYAWDLQSVDLEASTLTVRFSDNELTIAIADPPPPDMAPIAPGSFLMGSNAGTGPPYHGNVVERPVHQVAISRPFWIGRHAVTQLEYLAVMAVNPSWFQGASWPNSAYYPVETVSWHEAMAYCAMLTAQEAAAGRVPSGYEYRLPTEAEWEYCCRAATTTEFNCGSALYCAEANFRYSWHSNSNCWTTNGQTTTVGSYAPNAWGLFDMHGNVYEWCLDAWDGSANYPSSMVVDPYVQSGPYRVFRGGSWLDQSNGCRSAFRYGYFPTNTANDRGFRVVLAPILP